MNIPSVLTLQDNSFQLSRMRPSQVAHVGVPPMCKATGGHLQAVGGDANHRVQLNLALVSGRRLFDRFYAVAFGIKHAHQASGCMIIIFLFERQVYIITLGRKVKRDLAFFQVGIG